MNDDADDVSLPPLPQVPKKARRPRKLNQKELLNATELPTQGHNHQSVSIAQQPSAYKISQKEKAFIESKLTKAKNERQAEFITHLMNPTKKIILVTGAAGTGKTCLATEYGIYNFLLGSVDRLIFTRPNISVDEELGFLPGTLEEKLGPFVRPIYDILYNFVSPKDVQALMDDKTLEIAPLGFMRGRTFKNSWIVADEMQNCTIAQMLMLLTRIGEGSRLIITGDLEQSDIRGPVANGLEDFLNLLAKASLGEVIGMSSIVHQRFLSTDVLREPVIQDVLAIYGGRKTV
jgi:phosphate starvation-inducible PhoH-like protein